MLWARVTWHVHNSSCAYWKVVVKILKYLNKTKGLCSTFRAGQRSEMIAFAYSDFARNKDDIRAVSGGVTMHGGREAVERLSRTQRCVTLSSTEAEYVTFGRG